MTQKKRHLVRGEVIWPAAHLDLTLSAYQKEEVEWLENYRFRLEELGEDLRNYRSKFQSICVCR